MRGCRRLLDLSAAYPAGNVDVPDRVANSDVSQPPIRRGTIDCALCRRSSILSAAYPAGNGFRRRFSAAYPAGNGDLVLCLSAAYPAGNEAAGRSAHASKSLSRLSGGERGSYHRRLDAAYLSAAYPAGNVVGVDVVAPAAISQPPIRRGTSTRSCVIAWLRISQPPIRRGTCICEGSSPIRLSAAYPAGNGHRQARSLSRLSGGERIRALNSLSRLSGGEQCGCGDAVALHLSAAYPAGNLNGSQADLPARHSLSRLSGGEPSFEL